MPLTRISSVLTVAMLMLCFLASNTKADTITFTATLSGANENPPNSSKGTGIATVTLNDVTGAGTLTLTFNDLSAPVTGSHIHCCAPQGTNAGVIIDFLSSVTLSANKMSGSITSYAFTLNAAQITAMKGGLTYVNVHSTAYPGGEIRGQLAPVPEPGTLMLLGGGLVSMAGALRKRRAKKDV